MYLLLSIILATILGFFLMLDPLIGGVIAFGIIGGCLFRGVYLLNVIRQQVAPIRPKSDKVQETYETYLKEREKERSI